MELAPRFDHFDEPDAVQVHELRVQRLQNALIVDHFGRNQLLLELDQILLQFAENIIVSVILKQTVSLLLLPLVLGFSEHKIVQFGCSEEKGDEMVIVEAPNPVGSGGLQVVEHLDFPDELDVLVEDVSDGRLVLRGFDEVQFAQTKEEDCKGEFMACSVVDSHLLLNKLCANNPEYAVLIALFYENKKM